MAGHMRLRNFTPNALRARPSLKTTEQGLGAGSHNGFVLGQMRDTGTMMSHKSSKKSPLNEGIGSKQGSRSMSKTSSALYRDPLGLPKQQYHHEGRRAKEDIERCDELISGMASFTAQRTRGNPSSRPESTPLTGVQLSQTAGTIDALRNGGEEPEQATGRSAVLYSGRGNGATSAPRGLRIPSKGGSHGGA